MCRWENSCITRPNRREVTVEEHAVHEVGAEVPGDGPEGEAHFAPADLSLQLALWSDPERIGEADVIAVSRVA